MRARELRDLSDEELVKRLGESRENLFNLRFQMATGALDNTARLKHAKHDIARILTIQAERKNSLERR
ncbi:MAG: 50S ribosomal protein L29 [Gaiellaceae bacterium]